MRKAILFPLTAAMMLAVVAYSFAGSVSGEFKTSSKGVIKPTEAVAFPVRSPQDPMKKVILVVLAEGTMDAEKALTSLDPRTALINQEGMQEKNYISFWIRPDGFVSMNATFHEGMVQYIDSTKDARGGSILAQSLEVNFSANTADRIAAKVQTSKPATTSSGDTYELNVEFDTPVTHPPAAKNLEAGGGESGKVLLALLSAIKTKDWQVVRTSVSSEILQDVVDPDASDEENFEYVVDRINLLLPKGKSKVIGGEERSDSAILVLQGEMTEGGMEAYYLVRMVKETEGWRFDRSSVAGFV